MGLDNYYVKSMAEIAQYDNCNDETVPWTRYFRGGIYDSFVDHATGRTLRIEWRDNEALIQLALELSRYILTQKGDFRQFEDNKEIRKDTRTWVADMCHYAIEGYGLYGSF